LGNACVEGVGCRVWRGVEPPRVEDYPIPNGPEKEAPDRCLITCHTFNNSTQPHLISCAVHGWDSSTKALTSLLKIFKSEFSTHNVESSPATTSTTISVSSPSCTSSPLLTNAVIY